MGFYGNITYNTYGVQKGQIKPEHLDREYWSIKDKKEIESEQEFRNFLGFEEVNEIRWNEIQELKNKTTDEEELNLLKKEENFIQQAWNTALINSKKSLFKFHFHPDFSKAQNLYGSGMLIGFVREAEAGHFLYFISLGGRAGQIFTYKLELGITPITSVNEVTLSYDEIDSKTKDAINYMLSETITTSQLKDKIITTDKINSYAVTTDKINSYAVTTDKIDTQTITPDKLDRDYLEKTYISSIEGYNILFSTIKILEDVGTLVSPTGPLQGTIYMIGELKLNLPYIYSNPGNPDYYIGSYERIYSFGKCLAWRLDDTTIYIVSCDKGWIFSVKLDNIIPDGEDNYYYSSGGQYFKLEFKPIESPMIKNKAITREKINFEAVGTDQIAQKAIKQGQLDKNSVITENIENKAITREKLADTYLDYEHITDISTVNDLNEKISGEKLFRFYVNPDSDLAQSGFSDGNYIAVPRGSSGSSASHALINLNDFTAWCLEAGSGYPKPLTNNWKRNYWSACYSLEEICNQVSPVDSSYPQLSILYVVAGLSGIPAGHYLSYSVSTGNGKKVFLISGDRLQNYIVYKTLKEDQKNFSYTLAKIADVEQKPLDEYSITANELISNTWDNIAATLLQQQIGYEAIFKYYGVTNSYTGIFSAAPDNSADQIVIYVKKIGNNIIKTCAYSDSGPSPNYKETLLFLDQSWSQNPMEIISK